MEHAPHSRHTGRVPPAKLHEICERCIQEMYNQQNPQKQHGSAPRGLYEITLRTGRAAEHVADYKRLPIYKRLPVPMEL